MMESDPMTTDLSHEIGHDAGTPDAHESHESHESRESHGGLTDLGYVQVAVALAIITGMEVYASYSDWLGRAFLPILLVLMIVKFFSVVLFFMHLRFDSKIFSALFYAGLFLAAGVYIVALFTFHFFDG
jgi:cytochrome c oxidase subunit 4